MAVSQSEGGTRSGLLWEVERILDELNRERERENSTYLPILLMENVPEVQGAGNVLFFNQWLSKLESLGYSNYFQILNAKDYGIPQNRRRCFMISIYGSYAYDFPLKLKLKYKLKDFLEKEVDEKYYLSDKMINYITATNDKWTGNNGSAVVNRTTAKTLNTAPGQRRCDASDYICDDLPENCDLRGGGLMIKENTEQGYKVAHIGDGVNLASRMKHQRGNVQKESIQTLKAQMEVGVVVDEQKVDDTTEN